MKSRDMFAGRLHRTYIIAQRPHLKVTDVALRDMETRVKKNHSVTSSTQTTSLTIRSTAHQSVHSRRDEEQRPIPTAFVHHTCKPDTRLQMLRFSQINSLASGKIAPASHMWIPCTEHHTFALDKPLYEPTCNTCNVTNVHVSVCVWQKQLDELHKQALPQL